MSGDPKQDYFSDGMTEDIITEPGKFNSFLVISRNSSFPFHRKANDVTEVAKIVPAIFDLSTALGLSGQFDHPEVLAAIARIEAAAHTARMPLAGVAFTRAQAETLLPRGSRVVVGFDVLWLRAQVAEMRAWVTPSAQLQ